MGEHPKLAQYKLSQEFYHPIHGWLAMLVCVLGTLFNLANILVLTHRDMRNPVNMILTGIQAVTGTRYPTLPGLFFYYPYPTRKFFKNFRVQGSNYTCCF